jgi:hypothetical protein
MVGLAEASSTGYRRKGRFPIPEKGQMSWAHPVISDGRLYVRNQDTLLVYESRPRAESRGTEFAGHRRERASTYGSGINIRRPGR